MFEINDFIQYQSTLFAHFAITNYHFFRFYYDYDQSQIDLVMILYELILAHVWINLLVAWIVWCHDSYNNFKTILFRSDHIFCCWENKTFACDLFDCISFKLDMKQFSNRLILILSTQFMITIETEYAYPSIRLLNFDSIWFQTI